MIESLLSKIIIVLFQNIRELEKLECPYCHKMVTQPNIRRHIRDIHLQEKRHQCDFCSKQFSQRSSLKRHYSTVHLAEVLAAKYKEEDEEDDTKEDEDDKT